MFYEIVFPKGAHKAVTFSYDDGQIYDRRLVEMFNKYGMKATFHLNAGTIGTKGNGDEFVTWDEIESLYAGHEVACHGFTHPFFSHTSKDQIVAQMWEERKLLEEKVHYPIRGMSYPYGDVTDDLVNIVGAVGMEYSRTVWDSMSFTPEHDFMKWRPTAHHNKAFEMVDDFKNVVFKNRLDTFYIWGHSFEFHRENTWNKMEEMLAELAEIEGVWYATNIELKDYLVAARSLRTTADGKIIYNPSAVTVTVDVNGKYIEIPAAKTVKLI